VGEFNPMLLPQNPYILNFNSRGAWGSSTTARDKKVRRVEISIPVVRGGVQRQAFILPDLSGFQSLISRIANKPKTNTTQ